MPGENDLFESTAGIDPVEFGSSLFEPSGHSEGGDAGVSPAERTSPPEGSPVPAEAPAGVTQAEWDVLPKAWKKEMEAQWKTATPEFRQYVHEREKQVTDGISRYSASAQNWAKVTQPFEAIMQEYPDADPATILATLAQNHIRMVKSTPDERRQHAAALARGYGVEFENAVAKEENGQAPQIDGFTQQQIDTLNRTFGPMIHSAKQSSDYMQNQVRTAANAEVDKFFSDPKNTYVNEVADDILSLMKKGQAESLTEAYEIAILRNPAVKARYIASLAAQNAGTASTASKLPNVKSSATPRSPGKSASIDDTIDAVIAKHYS